MSYIKNIKKVVSLILIFMFLVSGIPSITLSAEEEIGNEYLEIYDPFAELRPLTAASPNLDTGCDVDFIRSNFSISGTYDGVKNAEFNIGFNNSEYSIFSAPNLFIHNVSLRVGGWYNALCARQAYNSKNGNEVNLIFTAPHSGTYKLIPVGIQYNGGKSMLLTPKAALGNNSIPENYTQTFSVVKGKEIVWSKTLALSKENMKSVNDDISSDICVSLSAGEQLVFNFKSPNAWAPCDLYAQFKVGLTEYTAQNIWSSETATEYAGGEGTEEKPYRIKTAEQLRLMVLKGGLTEDGTPAYYTLMNDIYINEPEVYYRWQYKAPPVNWYSQELNTNKFAGKIDGAGHTIYGLYSKTDEENGVAGFIQTADACAEIKNLHIRKSYINGSVSGAFIGKVNAGTEQETVINGCSADGTVTVDGNCTGGFIGSVGSDLLVENSYFTGNLIGEENTFKGAVYGNCSAETNLSLLYFYSKDYYPLPLDSDGNIISSLNNVFINVYYCGDLCYNTEGITCVNSLSEIANMPTGIWYKLPDRAPLLKSRGEYICDIEGNDDEKVSASDILTLRNKFMSENGYENIISDINRDGVTDAKDVVNLKKIASNPLGLNLRNSVIQNIKYNSNGETYDKYEINFDLDIPCDNPYDPDEVTVNGIFKYPSGKTVVVPAFYMEPMKRLNENATLLNYYTDSYQTNGEPRWHIRFAGDEVGDYEFTIQVLNGGTDYYYEETKQFELTDSDSKGYLEISKENPQYFQNSADGSLFYGTGSNIAWVRTPFTTDPAKLKYEYFMDKLSSSGATLTRVWLCHWAWLEWMPKENDMSTFSYEGLGRYNQCVSASMDKIFEIAEKNGTRLILTLDDNNEQIENSDGYDSWKYNPYNAENGGPAESVKDYWKNAEVREYYKKRLRYIVARWGYSTSLASINLWNDQTTPNDDIVSYLNELGQYTKSITKDYRTLLFASNFTGDANEVLDYHTQNGDGENADKPRVIQECGYTSDKNYYKSSLKSTLWNELFFGSATTMVWSHDDVDNTDSWDLFGSIANYTADLDFNKHKYSKSYKTHGESAIALDATYNDDGQGFRAISANHLGDIAAWAQKATVNEFYINETNGDMMLGGISPKLYGSNKSISNFRNDPTFIVDSTNGGEMVVYATSIGSGTNKLTAKSNGEIIKQVELSGGVRGLEEDERYFRIELKPGRNEITLSNEGHDWIEISAYYFKFNLEAGSSISVRRLISENQQLALVQNTRYGEVYNKVFNGISSTAFNVKVPFYELDNGKYILKIYDIESGSYITTKEVTVTDNTYIAHIPEIEQMMAIKLVKSGS